MRATLIIFAVLLVGVYAATPAPQEDLPKWELLDRSPDRGNARHDDIFFVNESIGFLVNTAGEVFRTDDAGDSWQAKVPVTSGVRFRSVGFANENHGWAGTVYTPTHVLYETVDGGNSWTNITSRISGLAPDGICGLSVVSANVVVGVGAFFGSPKFVKTSDGGNTWTSTSMAGHAATLIDVHFFDESTGIAVGGTGSSYNGNAVVLITTDGGDSWETAYESTRAPGIDGEWGWKISFPTRMTGYVSVEYNSNSNPRPAKVLKTEDGGVTWNALSIPSSTQRAGLQGIGFVTPEIGWASGRGTTTVTTDGGITWTSLTHAAEGPDGQLDGRVNRIRLVNDTLAFATGSRVYRLSGRFDTSSAIIPGPERPATFTLAQNYPNPFNTGTRVNYELYRAMHVKMSVHDAQGRLVQTLVDRQMPVGKHSTAWDARLSDGQPAPSGVYFYLMDIGDAQEMKRMVLVK